MVKRRGFPTIGEKVIVTTIRITPYSALCKLEEYPGKEGMIHVSESSGKWVRDIRKFIKPNKTYVAKVLRIDEEKGHISLSLKRVSKKEHERKIQEYKKEQKAEKMLELLAKKKKMTLDQAYEKIGYELQEKFGEMFKAFETALKSPEVLERRGIKKEYVDLIHDIAKEKIVQKKIKIKAILNIRFFTGDGIDKIKQFLQNLNKKYKMEIKYISAPKYEISIETDNPKVMQRQLENQLNSEIKNIKNGEANYEIKER
ncbi:MAG: S1 RNA-binding domain-containing protein [Candidatus Aenigmarchaeota archaeon]|nr:S1 RNA-binding domain-containing protein [Candidatus Aenigmarchaeota archaeon]